MILLWYYIKRKKLRWRILVGRGRETFSIVYKAKRSFLDKQSYFLMETLIAGKSIQKENLPSKRAYWRCIKRSGWEIAPSPKDASFPQLRSRVFGISLPEVQSTRHFFRTVHAAVTPTNVLPAPHGRTMTPDRARPFPNILRKLFSCRNQKRKTLYWTEPGSVLSCRNHCPVGGQNW